MYMSVRYYDSKFPTKVIAEEENIEDTPIPGDSITIDSGNGKVILRGIVKKRHILVTTLNAREAKIYIKRI